jgi:TDG/mug DNA glycosylase family protein
VVSRPILEDVLAPGLKVVFCGTAPGRVSAQNQAYYAHPQNRFWRALHEVGLTPTLIAPPAYRSVLGHGIGLTDIAKYAFGQDNQLPPGTLNRLALEDLRRRILAIEPQVLAFTSLLAGSKFLGRRVRPGEQPEQLGPTRIWVLPSPSPKAAWTWSVEPWRALSRAVTSRHEEIEQWPRQQVTSGR